MTNVPEIEWTDAGFVVPSGPDILAGVQADINAAFGSNLNFALTTPQGQLAQSWAATIANFYALLVYYSNQTNPAFASGRMQDAIAAIYFLQRNPSEPTTLQVLCNGAQGVVIPVGSTVIDPSGNLYESLDAGTVGPGGTVTISFACKVNGPVPVPETVQIYQAVSGWDSATVSSGVEGTDAEGRADFELRRSESVAGNSLGPIGAIIGAVAAVDGVLDYFGYDNSTDGIVSVKGVSIDPNAVYICVAGGSNQDVAEAILSKKGAGAAMTGTTTVAVFDDNPLYAEPVEYEIKFQRPDSLQIVFDVQIVTNPLIPNDAADQIRAAIQDAFDGNVAGVPKARIGSTIYAVSYVIAIAALGPWALVESIGVNSANTPTAVFTCKIVGTTMTVDAIASGALAPGQSVVDASGRIADGTVIESQSSGSAGSTGTYVVSISQTVSGASFTGTGSGTTMTAASVTETIAVGDHIKGTGVPANTVILSQISGTPGGAGDYECSNTVTSSGDAITCWDDAVSIAAGTQASVAVDADQIPQLLDANIQVELS